MAGPHMALWAGVCSSLSSGPLWPPRPCWEQARSPVPPTPGLAGAAKGHKGDRHPSRCGPSEGTLGQQVSCEGIGHCARWWLPTEVPSPGLGSVDL